MTTDQTQLTTLTSIPAYRRELLYISNDLDTRPNYTVSARIVISFKPAAPPPAPLDIFGNRLHPDEPSIIYARLPIVLPSPPGRGAGGEGDKFPYAPTYRGLTPAQRGHYLAWLINVLAAPPDAGCLWLYLYNLERRLTEPAHAANAAAELLRLANAHSRARNFDAAVDAALAWQPGQPVANFSNPSLKRA